MKKKAAVFSLLSSFLASLFRSLLLSPELVEYITEENSKETNSSESKISCERQNKTQDSHHAVSVQKAAEKSQPQTDCALGGAWIREESGLVKGVKQRPFKHSGMAQRPEHTLAKLFNLISPNYFPRRAA